MPYLKQIPCKSTIKQQKACNSLSYTLFIICNNHNFFSDGKVIECTFGYYEKMLLRVMA